MTNTLKLTQISTIDNRYTYSVFISRGRNQFVEEGVKQVDAVAAVNLWKDPLAQPPDRLVLLTWTNDFSVAGKRLDTCPATGFIDASVTAYQPGKLMVVTIPSNAVVDSSRVLEILKHLYPTPKAVKSTEGFVGAYNAHCAADSRNDVNTFLLQDGKRYTPVISADSLVNSLLALPTDSFGHSISRDGSIDLVVTTLDLHNRDELSAACRDSDELRSRELINSGHRLENVVIATLPKTVMASHIVPLSDGQTLHETAAVDCYDTGVRRDELRALVRKGVLSAPSLVIGETHIYGKLDTRRRTMGITVGQDVHVPVCKFGVYHSVQEVSRGGEGVVIQDGLTAFVYSDGTLHMDQPIARAGYVADVASLRLEADISTHLHRFPEGKFTLGDVRTKQPFAYSDTGYIFKSTLLPQVIAKAQQLEAQGHKITGVVLGEVEFETGGRSLHGVNPNGAYRIAATYVARR